MGYAYVKKMMQAEGAEQPEWVVIRVEDSNVDLYLNPVQEGDEKWVLADKSEWVDGGESVLGEKQEDGSVSLSDGTTMTSEEVASAEEVAAEVMAEAELTAEVTETATVEAESAEESQ